MPQHKQSQATVTTVEDWTLLRNAVSNTKTFLPEVHDSPWTGAVILSGAHSIAEVEAVLSTIQEFVPRLLDAYAELWAHSMALMEAWETWQASKDQVYVPDASDMIQLKNEGAL